jgi:hypothetical protein
MSEEKAIRWWLVSQYGARRVAFMEDGSVIVGGLRKAAVERLQHDLGENNVELSRPLTDVLPFAYAVSFPILPPGTPGK